MSITENVRAYIRERKFINYTQLGEKAGIKRDRMNYLMKSGELNADEFINICKALEVAPETFTEQVGE